MKPEKGNKANRAILSNRWKGPLNCYHRAQCGSYHFCYRFSPTLCPPRPTGGHPCGNHKLEDLATHHQSELCSPPALVFINFGWDWAHLVPLKAVIFLANVGSHPRWLFGKLRHLFPCCNLMLTAPCSPCWTLLCSSHYAVIGKTHSSQAGVFITNIYLALYAANEKGISQLILQSCIVSGCPLKKHFIAQE